MSDILRPAFGTPIAAWWRFFAWRPIWTVDRGWVWLRLIYRRRIHKHQYLGPGGADFWFQHAANPTTGEAKGEDANG